MSFEKCLKDERSESSSQTTARKERKIKWRVVKAKTSVPSAPAIILSESCTELDSRSLDVPREPVKGVVCAHCDTEVELSTNVCPICGIPLDFHDNGLVRLFSDMEFEDDCSGEIVCPFCGEAVVLKDGACPSCLKLVHAHDRAESSEKVEPVVHGENVVFIHLDVEHGELDCLQRTPHRLGLEHLTVKLEGER